MSEDVTVVDLDLDAQEGQLREAAGKPIVIRFRGQDLEFPNMKHTSRQALAALQEGDLDVWLQEVLGESVIDELEKDEPIRLYHIEAIFEAVAEKNGMDVPKSKGSSRPSRNTRKR